MSSDYCATADINRVFGSANIQRWADMDADGNATSIAARIAEAIDYASDDIDDRFRRSIYDIPLSYSSATPATVTRWAATLAGIWLYESRGVADYNPDTGEGGHRLMYLERRVDKEIRATLAGQRELLADATGTDLPEPVEIDLTMQDQPGELPLGDWQLEA